MPGVTLRNHFTLKDYTKFVNASLIKAAQSRAFRVANAIRTEILNGMANTNREVIRNNIRSYRVRGTANRIHWASAPGTFPAILTGRLRASIKIATEVDLNKGIGRAIVGVASVGTKVNYASYLQFGTRYMAARPFMTLGYARALPTIERIMKQPFFSEAEVTEGVDA